MPWSPSTLARSRLGDDQSCKNEQCPRVTSAQISRAMTARGPKSRRTWGTVHSQRREYRVPPCRHARESKRNCAPKVPSSPREEVFDPMQFLFRGTAMGRSHRLHPPELGKRRAHRSFVTPARRLPRSGNPLRKKSLVAGRRLRASLLASPRPKASAFGLATVPFCSRASERVLPAFGQTATSSLLPKARGPHALACQSVGYTLARPRAPLFSGSLARVRARRSRARARV